MIFILDVSDILLQLGHHKRILQGLELCSGSSVYSYSNWSIDSRYFYSNWSIDSRYSYSYWSIYSRYSYSNQSQSLPASHTERKCLVWRSLLQRERPCETVYFTELCLHALFYLGYKWRGLNNNRDRWRWLKEKETVLRFWQYSESGFLPILWSLKLIMVLLLELCKGIASLMQCFKVDIVKISLQASWEMT